MSLHRFIDRTNDRTLPDDYAGDVLLWDIDKTYLDTPFDSVSGMLTIPFEFAVDKQAVPGAVPLIRALRRGPESVSAVTPLYFVSASPPQLREVIERKMTLDGVEYDGITFKDHLGLLKARRMRGVREMTNHVGYKLLSLLLYRKEIPGTARWWMFGDDAESDATIFSLFGEVIEGLRGGKLFDHLGKFGVPPDEREAIAGEADLIDVGPNPIEQIFIHLAKGRDPSSFDQPRTTATQSFLQTAMLLAQLGRVDDATIGSVAAHLRGRHVPETTIEAHIDDARDRLGVREALLDRARR